MLVQESTTTQTHSCGQCQHYYQSKYRPGAGCCTIRPFVNEWGEFESDSMPRKGSDRPCHRYAV